MPMINGVVQSYPPEGAKGEPGVSGSVQIPPEGSEERAFWLEAAVHHGFEESHGDELLPLFDPPAYVATEKAVLALMVAAREQGRKDAALASAPPAPSTGEGWKPIETVPKDGTKFDAWAVHPVTGSMGVRFSDVAMRGDGSGFGVVIHQPKAHWEYLEADGPTFPAWKLTHWRPVPASPSPAPVPGDAGDLAGLSEEDLDTLDWVASELSDRGLTHAAVAATKAAHRALTPAAPRPAGEDLAGQAPPARVGAGGE